MTQSPGERAEAEERFDGFLKELELMNRFEYDILHKRFLSKIFSGIRWKDFSIMIAFDLICANGHKFECWFKSGDSFDEQKSIGVIDCPVCHDNHVEKPARCNPETRREKRKKWTRSISKQAMNISTRTSRMSV
jgi:hypothetical protein